MMTTPDEPFDPDQTANSKLYDEVASLVLNLGDFPNDAQDFYLSTQAVHIATPEFLLLSLQFMKTGSEAARVASAKVLGRRLLGIDGNRAPSQTHLDLYRETYLDRKSHFQLDRYATVIWHFYNVTSTMDMDDSRRSEIAGFVNSNLVPEGVDPEVYWRGASALYIAHWDISPLADVQQHHDFIMEAGASEDLVDLILVAQERKIFSVPEIRAIIDQQQTITTGIREGVL